MQLNIEIEVQDCESLTLEIIDSPISDRVSIDDSAGIGDTDVTWSADKSASELADKVDKEAGKSLVSDTEIEKLSTVEQYAQKNTVSSVAGKQGDVLLDKSDVGLSAVDNTADDAKPVSTAVADALDEKVDKVAGMGLSSNDFTDPLREKLIGLEGTHWRGTFVSLAALQAGVTDPEAGDYADVDQPGADVERYIWDATDGIWVAQSGESAPITASQVKLLYESNPDTNAFTDADEAKLDGIEAGATANSTDADLLNRANHTGTQAISTVAGLQGELDAIGDLIGDIASALDAINGEVI